MSASELPIQRDGLIVREVGDETLVYDTQTDLTHALPPVTARVFAACGTKSFDALDVALGHETVTASLSELVTAGLVSPSAFSRRRLLARTAVVGGGVVAISTLKSPMAFATASSPVTASLEMDMANSTGTLTQFAAYQATGDGAAPTSAPSPLTKTSNALYGEPGYKGSLNVNKDAGFPLIAYNVNGATSKPDSNAWAVGQVLGHPANVGGVLLVGYAYPGAVAADAAYSVTGTSLDSGTKGIAVSVYRGTAH